MVGRRVVPAGLRLQLYDLAAVDRNLNIYGFKKQRRYELSQAFNIGALVLIYLELALFQEIDVVGSAFEPVETSLILAVEIVDHFSCGVVLNIRVVLADLAQ